MGSMADTIDATATLAAARPSLSVAVSIYASREDLATVLRTLRSLATISPQTTQQVDVVVNGNPRLASRLAGWLARRQPWQHRLRIWHCGFADKATAWNHYVHRIAPLADDYVFVDGYCQAAPGAIGHLIDGLRASPQALAATGLPEAGPSARWVAGHVSAGGGLHGNLYALTRSAVRTLRQTGFSLPAGLYRTDGVLGAVLAFGLDLHPRQWRPQQHIVVVPQAAARVPALAWWRPRDLRTHWRRRKRQAQGRLETAAVRHHFEERRLPLNTLPRTAAGLVRAWLASAPSHVESLVTQDRLARGALRELLQPRDWSWTEHPPSLVFEADFRPTLPQGARSAPASAAAAPPTAARRL